MRTEYKCDNCIHSAVCSKKKVYRQIVDKVDTAEDSTIQCVRFCSDVYIEVNCVHFSPISHLSK